MTTPTHAGIINAERKRAADAMTEHLKKIGVDVRIAHYSGDSSYPTEYTLDYQGIQAVGPTFDLALLAWIEKLIEVAMKPASSYQAMESALKALAGGLSNLRTELLVVTAEVVKGSEQEEKRKRAPAEITRIAVVCAGIVSRQFIFVIFVIGISKDDEDLQGQCCRCKNVCHPFGRVHYQILCNSNQRQLSSNTT